MTEFQAALARFLSGQLDFPGLEATLLRTLQTDPGSADTSLQALDQLFRTSRLPAQIYIALKQHIPVDQSQPPAPPQQMPPAHQPGKTPPQPPSDTGHAQTPAQPQSSDILEILQSNEPDPAVTRPPGLSPAGASITGTSAPAPHQTGQDEPPPSDDKTVFRQSAPPTAPPGLASVPHTGTGPPSQTGPTGGITGATGGTGAGTGTGSSWTDPAKWGAEPAPTMQAGSILKDRYVLETVIGRGGMGVVFKARDMRREEAQDRNPYVAVKILNDEFRRHPESLKALQRESRKAQDLAHPNIVTVFDFDRDGTTVYMTMEFMEGRSLDKITKNAAFDGMPMSEAYPLIEGLGLALGYAHRKGIVHSDFKPANAFLTNDDVIKVFDFGIARAAKLPGDKSGEMTLFDPGTLGALTPAYASCEMLDGEEPDARDDIYALACISYELLTGKHPFDKRSAAEARDNELTLVSVKGLNRRQWRGLQRGLAFRREDRSPNVETFLDDLKSRKLNKAYAAGAIAAAAALILIAVLVVPSYLQERRVNNLIATIGASNDTEIPTALESLQKLDSTEQDTVKGNSRVRNRLVEYYIEQIELAQEESDFPRAEALVQNALSLYPDSNGINSANQELQRGKAELLAELDSRYNTYLQERRLLPADDENITDVLRIYQQIDPNNAALTDPRLAIAYADAAQQALAADVGLAAQYLAEGLQRFPGDSRLVDLNDRLNTLREVQDRKVRVAELKRQLSETLPSLGSLEAFRQIEDEILQLETLDPTNQLVSTYRNRLESLMDTRINAAIGGNDWSSARNAVSDYRRMLRQKYSTAALTRIDAAESTYNERVGGMFANVVNAVQQGELSQAEDYLNQLQQQGANPVTLREATETVSRGYLAQARSERAAGRFEDAIARIEAGRRVDPDFSEWPQELDAIAAAERLQAEGLAEDELRERAEQRMASVDELQKSIRANLALDDFGIESAGQTLEWINELGRLDPSASLSTEGRNQVAAKLATEARATGFQNNRWDEALELVTRGIELIPGANILRQAREQLQSERTRYLAQIAVAEEENLKSDLDRLLGSPTYDSAWESDLRSIVQSLEPLASAADYLSSKRLEIAQTYVQQAESLFTENRFDLAERMLNSSQWFVPDFGPAGAVWQRLAKARSEFEVETRQHEQLAEIDGLKRTFGTELNAERIRDARNAWERLRELLPAGDAFVTNEAPQAIADTYFRMATRALAESRFDTADELAQAGQREFADHPGLIELLGKIGPLRLEANVAELEKIIQNAPAVDAVRPKNMLATVRRDAGTQYPEIEAKLRKLADKRVLDAGTNREAVVGWIAKIFPGYSLPKKEGPPCTQNLAGFGGRARGRCFDYLPDSRTEGPRLVVVPAGSGVARPFAIARHEISVGQWNAYCRLSGNCEPRTDQGEQVPITNIKVGQVLSYATWLSGNTKHVYRLPTDAEWVHAATADGSAKPSPNCVNPQAGLGDDLLEVNRGGQNAWGVMNYVGNAQEWVIGPTGGYVARGGAYKDRLGTCNIELARPHAGTADELTGFRLVRELEGEA